jgi:hypothetical protein
MAYVGNLTTPATDSVAARTWKTRLVASAQWSVVASGDGSTLYGASSDVITNDSGAGSMANTNAWMRLRRTGTTFEYLLFRTGAATWTFRASALGFLGGSPSATVQPTATDVVTFVSSAQLFPTDNTYRLLVCAEDASPAHWWAGAVPIGGGAPRTLFGHYPMRAAPGADASPYSAVGGYNVSDIATVALLTATSGATRCFHNGVARSCQWNGSTSTAFGSPVGTVGAHLQTGEELPIEIPVTVGENGPFHFGPKGYLRDARYALSTIALCPTGTHLTQGSDTWVRMGALWLRWDAVEPAL